MKALLAFTFLLLSTVVTSAAVAQDVGGQTSAVEERQKPAGSREPANPVEAWPLTLKGGQAVKVRDETGRATRGKVVSISDSQLVIARRQYPFPYFRHREERTFAKDAVRSIEFVDSRVDGALIGAAAGAGLLAAAEIIVAPGGPLEVGKYLFIPYGATLGYLLDGLINRTIYEHQPQAPRVTIAPMLGRERTGLMARLRF